ncbi:MAG: DNA-3-methyladenine glycosylase family protein [Archangium sp.]
MTTFRLEAPFGFALSAAADFYAGFTPMGGAAEKRNQSLTLSFLTDETFDTVQVTLTQQGAQIVVDGADAHVGPQLSRMLGLDVDGHAWRELGKRVPQVGELQQSWPGFFTAGFLSPYEAGIGGVLSQRASMKQANVLRQRMAVKLGELGVVPSPRRLLEVKSFDGVPQAKWDVLHGLARAALDGVLDSTRLRSLPHEFALAQLQQIQGIGPWTAAHMLIRGATTQDVVPMTEHRVQQAFAHVFDRPASEYVSASEAWRPFRSWVSVLLMRALVRDGLWNASGHATRARDGGGVVVRMR